ncbi:hypothetical protein VTO73DRAFT_4726 [Trametes versicolor]
MSSDADAAAQLVLLYQAADSNLYWTSCAFALLFYDYILTFRHEVRFVWGRKSSAATACPGIGRFITVLEVIPYIIWSTFSALRAYALSSRTTLIGIVVFILSLVPAGVNAYFFSTFVFINLDPPSNCTALSDITPELSKTCTHDALYPHDYVLVIAVTWANTYRLRKASHDARVDGSFSGLLLRDGTIYFAVLIAMNVVHMTLNTVKPNNIVQQASYVTILENPITSILISRFILNLRAVDHRGVEGGDASDTLLSSPHPRGAASTMRFVSVESTLEVLGASLGDELDEEAIAVGGGEDAARVKCSLDPEKAHVGESETTEALREARPPSLTAQSLKLKARDQGPAPRLFAEAGPSTV